jgi:hypothetical protein
MKEQSKMEEAYRHRGYEDALKRVPPQSSHKVYQSGYARGLEERERRDQEEAAKSD